MASACVSSISLRTGSLTTSPSPRPETTLLCFRKASASRLPHSLFSLADSRSLSFQVSRTRLSSRSGSPKSLVSFVRADFRTEEVDTLDAPVGLDDDEKSVAPPNVSDFEASREPPEGSKLYVGNLPWTCNSQELADVFQSVGSVEMVEVIYDRESGRSRGFGFVTMSSIEDANVAIEKLDGSDHGGRSLRVNFPGRTRGGDPLPPRPRYEDGPPSNINNTNKLFVGNLPWGIDDVQLEQLFSEHGKVLEAKVVYDRESGRSRGFGFVTLSSGSEVNEAINNMDGADVEGRSLRVNLAADRPAPRQNFF